MPLAGLPGLTGAGEDMPAIEVPETDPAVAVKLRALVLEEVRWCRRPLVRGWENPEPALRCCSETWVDSAPEAVADVEEVSDTTEAFWAARRMESSRVSRLT